MSEPLLITSRDNPLLKRLRLLSHDSTAYRKQRQVWLEGDHLCRALLTKGFLPSVAVFTEAGWERAEPELQRAASKAHVISDSLMAGISALESAPWLGFLLDMPDRPVIQARHNTVVLDRLQDAGNVGSILRSAAAMGFGQVLALKGTAGLWSPKVLRAGMGAHFALHLCEGLEVEDLASLSVPLLVTSSHQGDFLHQARLPDPCAWVLGHEGQGVSHGLAAQAAQSVRISQPGGEESLNVAAAAAICLHASATCR
jgi:RNA methyltransferase, TrmH family